MRRAAAQFMAQPGVQVFTTCGARKKRDYLQQTFPFLDDAHIGDSRSTSFEDLIKEQVRNPPLPRRADSDLVSLSRSRSAVLPCLGVLTLTMCHHQGAGPQSSPAWAC